MYYHNMYYHNMHYHNMHNHNMHNHDKGCPYRCPLPPQEMHLSHHGGGATNVAMLLNRCTLDRASKG